MQKIISNILLFLVLKVFALDFESQYIRDKKFANGYNFKDVTDVEVNPLMDHVFVLQRSKPPVTVWSTQGEFVFAWNTSELGYPHSITLNGSDPLHTTVWITDMAGTLTAGDTYGHCIKLFTYYGKYMGSIGNCGKYTNGSRLNPIEFDKVTDIAWSNGYYYIADGDLGGLNNRVLVLNASLGVVDVWNHGNVKGSGDRQFNLPHTIAVDMCSRIWISDAQNSRIQVYRYDGIFLGGLDCFNKSLVYGLDFLVENAKQFIILTTKTAQGNVEVLTVPITMDCSNIQNIGECRVQRKFVLSWSDNYPNSMLHSVTVDVKSHDIYITKLPGKVPPIKFFRGENPPAGDVTKEYCGKTPPLWPKVWSATALLTPYTKGPLKTAKLEYNASKQSMYIKLIGPNETIESLVVKDLTYEIKRKAGMIECLGPIRKRWSVPPPNFLDAHQCICRGDMNTSRVNTVIWQCPSFSFVDWFWFKQPENISWRIFLNNNTNPRRLPVIGDYTMIQFASYNTQANELNNLYHTCLTGRNQRSVAKTLSPSTAAVAGFSYKCSTMKLPMWADNFYLTATMFPVNNYEPLPTQVLYYWKEYSQKTSMYSKANKYNAYLIKNNTYVTTEYMNKTVKCNKNLHFGPPRPDWMAMDCQCMGTLTNNSFLSPWPSTSIAVCLLENKRVFWTWFGTTETAKYLPVLFFETLAPPQEGTSLSFADYHKYYPINMLIDLQDFNIPNQCSK